MGYFLANDKMTKIFYQKWDNVQNPIAILQIVHGMSEHIERYQEFAEFLNSKNIIVYGMNLRGHGKTGENASALGHFEKDEWNHMMEDIEKFRLSQEELYQVPSFILGHSMGSFLTRTYLNQYSPDMTGAIIVGTGNSDKTFTYKLTKFFAGLYRQENYAYFIHKTAFKSFEKQEPFDWICSDKAQVQKYKNDPFCGFWMTAGFYYEFMKGLLQLSAIESNSPLKKSFPLLFLAGEEDPVGDMGRFVLKAVEKYNKQGFTDVNLKIYDKMRHEILNETNRQQVYQDVLNFILSHTKKKDQASSGKSKSKKKKSKSKK